MSIRRRIGRKTCFAAALCAFAVALAQSPQPAAKCPDSPDKCLKPVKFIAKGSCYVYACQYGTAKVHLINVDGSAKQALDKLAADDTKK
jgi:hypothetical protein